MNIFKFILILSVIIGFNSTFAIGPCTQSQNDWAASKCESRGSKLVGCSVDNLMGSTSIIYDCSNGITYREDQVAQSQSLQSQKKKK